MVPSPLRTRAIITVVVAGASVLGLFGPPLAQAQDEPARTAVVTPLLEAARVGNQLGPALLCPTALGVVQQALAFGPPEVARLASETIERANDFCRNASEANAPVIETMIEQAAALSPANPALDAAIENLADLLATTGTSSGDMVGGRSLAQMADLVRWLHS